MRVRFQAPSAPGALECGQHGYFRLPAHLLAEEFLGFSILALDAHLS